LVGPPLAAFIHVTSELAFILNSARLLPRREAALRAPETPRHTFDTRKLTGVHAAN
jgi:hypothetical protein